VSRALKDVATGIRQLQRVQALQVQSNGVLDQLIRCDSLGHGGEKSQLWESSMFIRSWGTAAQVRAGHVLPL